MRLSAALVLVLAALASSQQVRDPALLTDLFATTVVGADLPPGHRLVPGNRDGWTITATAEGPAGETIGIVMTWADDSHPLSIGGSERFAWLARCERAADAVGAERVPWAEKAWFARDRGSFADVPVRTSERDPDSEFAVGALFDPPRRRVASADRPLLFTTRMIFHRTVVDVAHDLGPAGASPEAAEATARAYAERLSARVRGALEWERWTPMDTYVRDRFVAMGAEDLAPEGFGSLRPDGTLPGIPHDGSSAYEELRRGSTTFIVQLELAPLRGAVESAAAKHAAWLAPDANVHRVFSESLGLGEASLSFRPRMPPIERAFVFDGRWTLSVVHKGPMRDKWNPDAWAEDEIVEELESYTARLWGAFLASEPERRPPPAPSDAPPVVAAQPEPEPEPEPEPDALDERDRRLLDAIAEMDALLGDVEQPLQEALVQLGVLTRHQASLRRSMKELSRAASTEQDRKLVAKMRERIGKLLGELQDGGRELVRLEGAARRHVAEALEAVRALYEGDDWGPLEDAARTRFELIEARSRLFDAQVALVTGDLRGARQAAEAMRGEFRLRSHAAHIEGMALLQEGRTLDALAVFRAAARHGSGVAGPLFESLVRETEVRALRGLQSLAGITTRAMSAEFDAWIASRAETNAPKDRTTFEWMVERFLKRPWYDTIGGVTGVGIAEADERSREAALVADDMAVTHVGLNFVIGLRRDLSLREIRDLDTDALRAAAAERWGRELPEDQLTRMRTAIRHAFELPDLQKLTDETAHIERSSFSGPLVEQLGLQDRWGQAAQVAAMGASTVNGWTALTTLAPAARLSVAASGRAGAAAGEALEKSVMLGEYFATSRPVQAAVQALDETAAGKAALAAARRIDDVAQASTEGAVLVGGAQMVLEGGLSVVAGQVGGEAGVMLADAVSALGLTGVELPAGVLRRLDADAMAGAAQRLAARAASQRRQAEQIADALRRVDAGDDAPVAALGGLAGVDDDAAARLRAYAETVASGRAAAVAQARRDVERLAAYRARLAEQTAAGAAALEDLTGVVARTRAPAPPTARRSTTTTPSSPADARPIGDPLAEAGTLPARAPRIETEPATVRMERDRAIGDPLADVAPEPGTARPDAATPRPRVDPVGDPLADAGTVPARASRVEREPGTVVPERGGPVGDPLAEAGGGTSARRPGTEVLDTPETGASTARAPSTARADGTPRPDGASTARNPDVADEAPALIERPADPAARLALRRSSSPTHAADWHFADGDYDAAILEYQRVLTELPPSSPRRDAITARIDAAREVLDERARLAAGASAPAHTPPLRLDAVGERRVQAAVTGPDAAERWVRVTSDHSASVPRFVKDADGRRIAVTKSELGMSDHPQGRAEHLAALISERLGRPSPRARLGDFTVDVDGTRQRQLMLEMMPPGVELAELEPTTAQLLAHRDAFAEDLVYSLVIGDGDRHFGNYLVSTSGEIVPFDYGLADLFPVHPYRHPHFIGEVQELFDAATDELDELLAVRAPTTDELDRIDRLRRDVATYQRNALYHDLSDKTPVPGPGDAHFEAFVRRTAHSHLAWGTRSWRDHPLFLESMTQETFAPHLARIRRALGEPGVLDAIVDEALAGHPDIEFTRELLRTRLEVLGDVLAERFPARPDGELRTGCRVPSAPDLGLDLGDERLDVARHPHDVRTRVVA